MKISLIMPVYNASASLARSLEGIAAQSFKDFTLVVVDDGSTDDSAAVIERFTKEHAIDCRLISAPVNGGVAAARNMALDAAEGEYVAFVDADDMADPSMLQAAVDTADSTGADIVGWDWTLGFERNGRYMRQYDYSSPLEALKHLMGGTMRWNLWLFLYRRKLLVDNGIRFTAGANMGEDMAFTIQAFCRASRVAQLHRPLYNYNAVSETSISRRFSDRHRAEIDLNIASVVSAVQASPYAAELSDHIQYLKLYNKLPLLISSDKKDYETWYSWMPEANAWADRNKALPYRTRWLQKMASRRCWTLVRLYHSIVYKFVYGIIYR